MRRVVADVRKKRAQILEVEQQQPVVVGELERKRQDARLRFVELENARPQQRAEIARRRANRVALLAEDVPEDRREAGELGCVSSDQLQSLLELRRRHAGLAHARQVSLDVGHEHRHADRREPLGDDLQRDRFAGAGRPGDKAVAVGECRQEAEIQVAVLGNDQGVGHRGTSDSKGMWRSLALALSAIDRT